MDHPRRMTIALVALALLASVVAPRRAEAQPAPRVYRVAYLTGASLPSQAENLAAFFDGMRTLGYVEGRNFTFVARGARGQFDRLPSLLRELIDLKPDVLFVATTPANIAAKAVTTKVPIVFVGVADPLGVGLVPSLARPGGNITGITNMAAELTGKRLEVLKEVIPDATRVAVLINRRDPNATAQLRNAEAAARNLGIRLDPEISISGLADIETAFATAAHSGAHAALRMVDPTVSPLRQLTTSLAAKYRLPVIYAFREDVEAGGLIAYGSDLAAQYRQSARVVDEIFRGRNPADIPVQQPTKFVLVVNLRAAKALGIAIPRTILLRADDVIE